jgi:predicted RNA-binding Zn-ribbon protein involved in translation (DUF1610 family)
MTEKARHAWQVLRFWRVVGIVALILVPIWPLVMVVLIELFDFPRSLHSIVAAPIFVVAASARQITSFECPECRRPFSRHERTGTHLSNKRCAHCGLAVGT